MEQPERRILLNPGPATTSDAVKQALVIADVCPREAEFCEQLADVRVRLARLVGDPAEVATVPVVGSGTTALEAMLVSLVPGDGRIVVIDNGDYGRRLVEIAEACGIPHTVVVCGWGRPVDLGLVERALRESAGRATHLAFVHAETSSGLLNPLAELTALGRKYGLGILLDAMSSFGALPIRVGADGVDAVVSSANKCLQGMAGLAFAVVRRRTLEEARRATPRSLVLNLVAEFDQLEKTGQMRFTVPPQIVSALRQALIELAAEGLEERGQRYAHSMRTLVAGLRDLGFVLLLEDGQQSGILVSIREPEADWYDFTQLHDALYAKGFTIYPGKPGGQPNFRLAVLGAIDSHDIERFLEALRQYLERVGALRGR